MKRITAFLLIAGLLATACQEDEQHPDKVTYVVEETMVKRIEIPATARVNEQFHLTLWFTGGDCTSLDRSETELNGYDITFKVFSKTATNTPCTYRLSYKPVSLTLKLSEPGEYTIHLNAWKIPGEYIITVE